MQKSGAELRPSSTGREAPLRYVVTLTAYVTHNGGGVLLCVTESGSGSEQCGTANQDHLQLFPLSFWIKNLRTLLANSADLSQRPRSLVKWTFNPEVGPGCRGAISGNKRPTPNSPTVSGGF